jgi:hypothetical protein
MIYIYIYIYLTAIGFTPDGSNAAHIYIPLSLYQLQFVRYNCSRFHRIFLTVISDIFNSRLALRIDFLELRVKASRTLSTVSSVTFGLPARPFP